MIMILFFVILFFLVYMASDYYGCKATFLNDYPKQVLRYFSWALAQQLLMAVTFTSLWLVFPTIEALLLAVLLFVILHFPNVFLMMTVLGMEMCLLCLYVNMGNAWIALLVMSVIHAIMATVLKNELPYAVHHGMKVLFRFSNIKENK